MKRIPVLAALLLTALVVALPAASADRTVTILHVSDTHSHLDAVGPRDASLQGTVGGIAKATTVIGRARAADPEALLLHAGDLFQGDPFFNVAYGVPELGWMAGMGFDAMTVGNHEFDFGPQNLAGILATAFDEAAVPLLSANATGLEPVGLAPFVRPSLVRTVGGVSVGIFGLTVPDDPMLQAAPVVLDADLTAVAIREVAALKAEGAEVVILLSHLGLSYDEEIAAGVDGIDLVVGAHDHCFPPDPIEVSSPSGRAVWIVQSSPYYADVGRVRLELDGSNVRLASFELLPVDGTVPPEPQVAGMVAELRAMVEEVFPSVFSVSLGNAPRNLCPVNDGPRPWRDSPVGNLVADALRSAGGTQIGLTTAGFLAEGIRVGPLVPADLFRVVSYGYDPETGMGFDLVTFQILGSELVEALELAVGGPGPRDAFFPQVSGLKFTYDSTRSSGHRVLRDSVTVGGAPVETGKTYGATANAALVSFLPLLGVDVTLVTSVPDVCEYRALLRYVQHLGGHVNPRSDGRIRDVAMQNAAF